MTVKILIKTKGSRAAVHVYDAENDCTLCHSWPKPGSNWEIREVESFSGVFGWKCQHCINKLDAIDGTFKELQKRRKPTRSEKELEKWERFTGKPRETEAILIA